MPGCAGGPAWDGILTLKRRIPARPCGRADAACRRCPASRASRPATAARWRRARVAGTSNARSGGRPGWRWWVCCWQSISATPCAVRCRTVGQGDLGGVGAAGEHGFAVEHAPQADPVQAAGQFAVDPGFDAVYDAGLMPAVGFLHRGGDPGAGLPVARRRALAHDLGEGRVHAPARAAWPRARRARSGAAACAAVRGRNARTPAPCADPDSTTARARLPSTRGRCRWNRPGSGAAPTGRRRPRAGRPVPSARTPRAETACLRRARAASTVRF